MNKAYKFRIYPNAEQKVMFSKTFGCTRMVYNYYLEKRIKSYEEEKITFGYTKCANDLTLLKKEKEFLQDVDSISLQQALRHLDTAFQNFFRDKKVGFPKFKSRKNKKSYTTMCVNNNIKLENGTVTLPKIGKVTVRQHRNIPADYILKSVTVSQTPSGKYYASILFEYENQVSQTELQKFLGLDFSMHELYVDSNFWVWIFLCTNYMLTATEIVPNFRDITDFPKRSSKRNKENCLKW